MRPVLVISLSIIAGVALAAMGLPWYVVCMAVTGVALLSAQYSLKLAAVAGLCVVVGFLRGLYTTPVAITPGVISTQVQATSAPILTESGYYRGVVKDMENSFRYLMYSLDPWNVGLRMEVTGELDAKASPQNPGELDYAAYLDRQGIQGVLFVRSTTPIALYPLSPLERARGILRASLSLLPDSSRGLAQALVLGDKSGLSKEVQDDWHRAGASHILAVSGLHIGIAAGAAYFLARRFAGFRPSWMIASAVAIFYASLIGASPSAWRAAVAFALVAIGKVTLREPDSRIILAVVAALLLLYNPLFVTDPGFLLSFVATAGLVWLASSFQSLALGPKYLAALVAAALSAQLATLPLVLSFFGAWPTFGLLSNMLLVPLAPLLVGTGLLAAILMKVPLLGQLASMLFWLCASLSSRVVMLISNLPGATFNLIALPVMLVALYYILLALFPMVVRRYSRGGAVLVLASLVLVAGLPSVFVSNNTAITFLSVGNADACHVRIGRAHYLIDAATEDAARGVVVPYLRAQGVNTLAGIFISHGDSDHVGGLNLILDEFAVKHVFLGPGIELLEGDIGLADGMTVDLGGVELTAWQAEGSELDLNNLSIVLLMEQGPFSVLFTGDIGSESEQILLPRMQCVDILKVAHHGSGSSSSPNVVEVLSPRVSVISVGANSYGHPASTVVETLETQGSLVLRTDLAGAVRVSVKGNYYNVHSFVEGRWQRVRTYSLSGVSEDHFSRKAVSGVFALWRRGVVYSDGHSAD